VGAARHRRRRNWGARVSEYDRDGLAVVFLESRHIRVGVLAGRGADVFEFLHKPTDVDVCWRFERPDFNPGRHLMSSSDGQSAFMDHYVGGWQEVFPNGGPPAEWMGARYGQHGEVAQLPWDHEVIEDDPERVAVRFCVRGRKTPVLLERVLAVDADAAALRVDERLLNESPVELRAMWGQHIVVGAPYLRSGSRVLLPRGVRVIPHPRATSEAGRRVRAKGEFAWPLAPREGGGVEDLSELPEPGSRGEMLYATGFSEGWYEVQGAGPALRVEWDAGVLPYLWLWQELGADRGHPWYGRPYVMGLEPFSSYPTDGLPAAVANDTALRLAPHEERRLTWSVALAERCGTIRAERT
jgi:Domain of unknown function (DUF4432)